MTLKTIYEISNKITIDSNVSVSELQNRLANSLRAEGMERVDLKNGGVEFQNYFPWGLASRFLFIFGVKQGTSSGRFEINSLDSKHTEILYKVSLFPLFCLFVFTTFFFWLIGLFSSDNILITGYIIGLICIVYGFYRSMRSSQFKSLIRKLVANKSSFTK